jgi:F-type H+-transporting ATPase subunit b
LFTVYVNMAVAGHPVVVAGHPATAGTETGTPDTGPSPIAPEPKELWWGGGAFVLMFVVIRYFLFPKVKKGMDARYAAIVSDHDTAEATRAAARAEVAEYEAELATIRATAARRLDAARQTLEAERSAALQEANARIAARRSEAAAAIDAARQAAEEHIRDAVVEVSGRAAELATGRRPDPAAVNQVVASLLAGGPR